MHNLHIVQDGPHSNWFVDRCLKFDTVNTNTFICIADIVKHIKNPNVEIHSNTIDTIKVIADEINNSKYDNVIISYLDDICAQIIEFIKIKSVNIIWIIWGGDLYYLPKFWNNIYDPYSASFLKVNLKNHLQKRYTVLKNHYLHNHRTHYHIYKAIKKISYCCTIVSSDLDLVKDYLNPKVKHIEFTISGIDEVKSIVDSTTLIKKEMILQVGNSADPSNNHYEILKKVKEIGFKNDIYCPLSYGNVSYAKKLQSDISGWFADNQFKSSDVFMPQSDYYKKISEIGFVIMGHKRQQSFGNIVAQLYFGAKVFLKKDSSLYKTFKSWGLNILTIEDDLNEFELSRFLSNEIQLSNRQIVSEKLSDEKLKARYINLLNVKV